MGLFRYEFLWPDTCNHLGEKGGICSKFNCSIQFAFRDGMIIIQSTHLKLLSLVILRTDGRLVRRKPQNNEVTRL